MQTRNTRFDSKRRNCGLNSIALTLLDRSMCGAKQGVLISITESMQKQRFSRTDNCSHVYMLHACDIEMRLFSTPVSFVAQLLMRYRRNLFAYFCFHTNSVPPTRTRIKIGIILASSIFNVRYVRFFAINTRKKCIRHQFSCFFVAKNKYRRIHSQGVNCVPLGKQFRACIINIDNFG